MESLIFLEKRQTELMDAIRETLKRVPAHSAKPRIMMDLFDLEDEYGRVTAEIGRLTKGRTSGVDMENCS
jgi:hypothetical protein